ncbi:hypothetical protein OH77DRAFT_1426798 [Trametes cingulata]|nr:hypothetical protein OH77DRAFT_1426798 [Trametes cingulata]
MLAACLLSRKRSPAGFPPDAQTLLSTVLRGTLSGPVSTPANSPQNLVGLVVSCLAANRLMLLAWVHNEISDRAIYRPPVPSSWGLCATGTSLPPAREQLPPTCDDQPSCLAMVRLSGRQARQTRPAPTGAS